MAMAMGVAEMVPLSKKTCGRRTGGEHFADVFGFRAKLGIQTVLSIYVTVPDLVLYVSTFGMLGSIPQDRLFEYTFCCMNAACQMVTCSIMLVAMS